MQAKIHASVLAGVLCASVSVAAHHSFSAEFDSNKPVTIQGTVTKVLWNNPHAWIHLNVKEPDGKVVDWAAEAGSPNQLTRRGWRKDTLAVGSDIIIVTGFQAKDGTPTMNVSNITLPDGRKVFSGSTGTGAPDEPK